MFNLSLSSKFLVLVAVSFASESAFAKKLSEYSPYDYDVRFTNPLCKTYEYEEPVKSRAGDELTAKPKNAYCKKADTAASAAQEKAPLPKILSWIKDSSNKEIFLTFLSYSNGSVTEALCEAIKENDVKVTLVLDDETELDAAKEVLECKPPTASHKPRLLTRGHVSGIGYAHNKFIIVNPASTGKIKIAFGSGNLTSGVVLHHENWHFITTSAKSYFAQAHVCVMEGELEHADSGREFKAHMKSCLEDIGVEPESDIRPFFVPGDGEDAMAAIQEQISSSTKVDLAAHRFSNTDLIDALAEKLGEAGRFALRLIFDDDMFWVGEMGARNRPNLKQEFKHVRRLETEGAKTKYVETNHGSKLLHHNKFIVFHTARGPKAAFVGAGNFTGDAFDTNLENFYMVTVPSVVKAMAEQYEHLYSDLATAEDDLPAEDVLP